tara:strand:+ start:9869 stop:10660 length:792 start_codon:yes stop_codon:yes gene_type:complete
MHLLIPKLTPMQLVSYFSALIICWVYGDGTTSEVLYAIDPVTAGILLFGSAAASAAPKIIEGIQAKRALKRAEDSPEAKALRRVERQARRRLKKGQYGLTEAEKRSQGLEGALEFTGQLGKLEADAKRGGGGQSAKDKRNLLKTIVSGTKDFMTKRRGGVEQLSANIAAGEKAKDEATVASAAANKYAREQGLAAANTALQSGIATGVGTGISMGSQAAGAGLFQKPDTTAQVDAIAQNINNRSQPTAVGTPQPAGQATNQPT